MNRFEQLRARISEQVEAMSPRDRMLAFGLVVALSVLVVAGITWGLHGVLDDRASRVKTAKDNLAQATELAAEHAVLQQRIQAAEGRMAQFKPSQLGTHLETWATQSGVLGGLKSPQEVGENAVGDYAEKDFRVAVQRADLDGILRFLYAIETSPYPIRIKAATFSVVQVKEDRFIDLGLELVTFTKKEGG